MMRSSEKRAQGSKNQAVLLKISTCMSAVSGGECETSRSLHHGRILYGVLCRRGSVRNGAKPLEGFTYPLEGPTELDLKLITP